MALAPEVALKAALSSLALLYLLTLIILFAMPHRILTSFRSKGKHNSMVNKPGCGTFGQMLNPAG